MLTINPVIWMTQIKRGLKHKHVPAVICFVFLAQQYTAKKKTFLFFNHDDVWIIAIGINHNYIMINHD